MQPEVQRIVAAAGKLPVHGDQILDAAHFAREHDAISGQTQAFSARRRFERRGDEGLPRYGVGIDRFGGARVLVHEPRKQLLIEAAPVDADSHGLVVAAGHLDQGRELLVALGTPPDIARVDSVLCQRPRAIGVLGEELVPVEMEIAHQGHVATQGVEPLADARDLRRRLGGVDGDPHDFRTGTGKLRYLGRGTLEVGGIGIRHRLHQDRRASPDQRVSDPDLARFLPRNVRHRLFNPVSIARLRSGCRVSDRRGCRCR